MSCEEWAVKQSVNWMGYGAMEEWDIWWDWMRWKNDIVRKSTLEHYTRRWRGVWHSVWQWNVRNHRWSQCHNKVHRVHLAQLKFEHDCSSYACKLHLYLQLEKGG